MSVSDEVTTEPRPRIIWRAMRPHQWVKNALLFVPILLAHELDDLSIWLAACVGFVAFSLCASAAYLINDAVDLEADRRHPTRRLRPFASGALAPGVAYVLSPVLIAGGFVLAWLLLPPAFLLVLAGYVVITFGYSFGLKQLALVDVLVLAGLYTLRILAGGAATGIVVSQWAIAFSMFFFLSLALLKRYAELRRIELEPGATLSGRGYRSDDLALLRSAGPSAGFISVLILALYVTTPEVLELYARPSLLWIVGAILVYWILRVWMKAHRGEMHDDPVLFAVRDRASRLAGILTIATLMAASI